MTRRPYGSDGPEDVDAAFAEIVAGLERDGLGAAAVEDDLRAAEQRDLAERADHLGGGEPSADPPGWRLSDVEWDSAAVEEEHYVPPEPPPLPRPKAGTIFGILLLTIGVLLLVGPGLIGLEPRIATPLALVSLATGIGWLVLRMRQGPPPDSGWDDGAQL